MRNPRFNDAIDDAVLNETGLDDEVQRVRDQIDGRTGGGLP